MTALIWRDPPTIDAKIDRVRMQPGRWAMIDKRKTVNAARCKVSELRKRYRDIEFRVCDGEIYARG